MRGKRRRFNHLARGPLAKTILPATRQKKGSAVNAVDDNETSIMIARIIEGKIWMNKVA